MGALASAVFSFLAAVATVGAFVWWTAEQSDARALARQTHQAQYLIDRQLQSIAHDQESVAIWDDSVLRTKVAFNYDWIEMNLGAWMADYFGHDGSIVLNDADKPIYAMDKNERLNVAAVGGELKDLAPMIAQLRASLKAGAAVDYTVGRIAEAPRVTDLVIVGGKPVVASIMPLITDSGNVTQLPGTEYVLISTVNLDQHYADNLATGFTLAELSFVQMPTGDPVRTVLPLSNKAGRFITFVEWVQDRPGQTMIEQSLPGLAGAFVVVGVIVALLLWQLSRSSSALESGRAAAAHQANHDALTGLPNRANFDGELARALAGPHGRDQGVAVLLLDLDRFKLVNDTLGHEAGDDLIRAVGQRLKQILMPGDMLARLGGDEFAIVHRHRFGTTEPMTLGQRIVDALGKTFEIQGSEVFVGGSIGVAVAGLGDEDARELTRRADIALFEAKATGRNRAVLFEESMSQLLHNRQSIEAELREALRRDDQLSVSFQPLYGADGLKIIGAEALARWHHPKLGQVSPAHFIPVAENSGLILKLGEMVIERACELGTRWPGLLVAVNISPVQLRNPQFCEHLLAQLRRTGMRASDLELEITEGILLEDAKLTTDALETLRGAGIHIALDDFGTGYSSLNYLKRYPVDRIKIDRSFVSQLSSGGASVAIVQAMVTLAHALGIQVTAEGVETDEQLAILRSMGCNVFQGFLLSPPVSVPGLEPMLRAAQTPAARVA